MGRFKKHLPLRSGSLKYKSVLRGDDAFKLQGYFYLPAEGNTSFCPLLELERSKQHGL